MDDLDLSCVVCGEPIFRARRKTAKYCSVHCKNSAYRERKGLPPLGRIYNPHRPNDAGITFAEAEARIAQMRDQYDAHKAKG